MLALVEPCTRLDADYALDEQALDKSSIGDTTCKRLEVGFGEELGHIYPLERIPQIGFVRAISHHGVAIFDPRPRRFIARPSRELLEGLGNDILNNCENLILGSIAHLDIELVKLARAAVGTRRLVTEARCNLEILVEARHHQKLLEHLRRLRQSVKHSTMNAARHEIVARSFRRRCRQNGRLKLVEALLPHLLAQEPDNFGAQDNVVVELLAPQIKIAML